MSKARTDKHGRTREQKLINENDKLKRQVSSLRKQLARVDLDRYQTIKDMVQEHYTEDRAQEGKEILESVKKTWLCRDCQEGYLQIFIYNHSGKTWYYRTCSLAPSCGNRTLAKQYDPKTVKGIVKSEEA